jgi:chromate reductase
MPAPKIAVLVGSLRKDSVTRKVVRAIEPLAPDLSFTEVEIGDLPLYNQDLEVEPPPAAWARFRGQLNDAVGYLFATPEYNRSIPGALKNAIDVASRPYGKSAFGEGKPGAVISVSPGAIGGFGANHHVRQSLVSLDLAMMQAPEMYVNNAFKLFDGDGKLADEAAKGLFTKFGATFTSWVKHHHPK